MSASDDKQRHELRLRAAAERQIDDAPLTGGDPAHSGENLLYELQVHQVELEIQNETLRQKQTELEVMRDRYVDLYEFAPVGYLTLTADGMIDEINLATVKLLGAERKDLLHRRFTSLVIAEDQARWMQLFLSVKELDGKGSMELALQRRDDTVLQAQLDCATRKVGAGDTAVRIALTDISERKQLADVDAFLSQTDPQSMVESFFDGLARFLARSLQMDYVCIDRLEGDGLNATTQAVWHDGRFEANVTYALKDTPCGDVVGQKVCCFPASVSRFFPHDQALQDLRAESYIGITLWSHTGQPIGLIAVIGRHPLENRSRAEVTMERIASRAAGELERLMAEDALKESEALYRSVTDHGQALIWMAGPDKGCYYFNKPWLSFTGRTLEQESGNGWAEGVHPDDLQRCLAIYTTAFDQREKFSMDYRLRYHDGEYHWILDDGTPHYNVQGEFVGYVGHCLDITARKQAEAKLKQYQDHLEELIFTRTADLEATNLSLTLAKNAAGLGVFDRDIKSGKLSWDLRVRELFGVGPDEPITFETFMALLHPDDRAETKSIIAQACISNGSCTNEFRVEYRVISRADGSVRYLEAQGRVYFEEKRAVRLIGIIRDVTERRQIERTAQAQRIQMEHLVNQQVAVHTASAIAHELNQPLVSISAFSEAALDMLKKGANDQEKLHRALQGAVEQTQRAGRVLHELITHLHKGGGQDEAELVDLNEVIRQAVATASESNHIDLNLVVELERDLPLIHANALQLKKVLLNLLTNAFDAMQAIEKPSATNTIKVRSFSAKNMDHVTVQDSGPGLNAAIAPHVFDPFFSTKPAGIGLGLAISRALVEAHGGQLWVDLDACPGATFHLTVPITS